MSALQRASESDPTCTAIVNRTSDSSCEPDTNSSLFPFKRCTEVHSGSISSVYQAVDVQTGRPVAIKKYHKRRMYSSELDHVAKEAALHKRMSGDFVAEFHSSFEDKRCYYIVSEWCPGGDLFGCLPKHGLHEHHACVQIVVPLLRVLEKMHAMNIMHRDIKPENIFLGEGPLAFRLGDFGCAIDCSQEIPFNCAGTPSYMAPEVLTARTPDLIEGPGVTAAQVEACGGKPYTSKADVWSVGVLAYEVVMGKTPFKGTDKAAVTAALSCCKVHYSRRHSSAWADFVRACLVKDPEQRADVQQLLMHPWVQYHLRLTTEEVAAKLLQPLSVCQSFSNPQSAEDGADCTTATCASADLTCDTPQQPAAPTLSRCSSAYAPGLYPPATSSLASDIGEPSCLAESSLSVEASRPAQQPRHSRRCLRGVASCLMGLPRGLVKAVWAIKSVVHRR